MWLDVCTGDHRNPEEMPQMAFLGEQVRESFLKWGDAWDLEVYYVRMLKKYIPGKGDGMNNDWRCPNSVLPTYRAFEGHDKLTKYPQQGLFFSFTNIPFHFCSSKLITILSSKKKA